MLEENIWECFNTYEENPVINKDFSELLNITEEAYQCVDCKSVNLNYSDGRFYCGDCGFLQCKKLSLQSEYRFYGSNDTRSLNPERVGMPTNSLLPKSSLGTFIKKRSYDPNSIKRLVQFNSWNQMPYKERSLYKIHCKIKLACSQVGLPKIIIERASELYGVVKDVNISRGDNREGLIAACIYFACKDESVPRSSKEIAQIFKITPPDMTRGIKNFRINWELAHKSKDENICLSITNPINYIERYCSPLNISSNIKFLAEFIAAKSIFENLVDDNTAPSIAAGSIFMACMILEENISKKTVAESCKTSEVTISKCYKKLNENKLLILPMEFRGS
tara:strand:- start:494 stop:1498 length:1005 start_codon:yes stop_codon:yes gene_type:complete